MALFGNRHADQPTDAEMSCGVRCGLL